jgi:beta-lactamase regulating signal transducer with metallopeptidase domain
MRATEVLWALAAALPLGAAGLIAVVALERAGVSVKVRERVFSLAFWLGPVASGLALAADALPQPTTAQITFVLRSTPLGALSQATRALAQAPRLLAQAPLPHAPRAVEFLLDHMPGVPALLLGAVVLGLAFRLAQLGRAWLALRALRRGAVEAPAELVRAARAAGLQTSVPVKLSVQAPTPVAVGLFAPVVLLPERFAAPEAIDSIALVCRHEALHIGRRDNLHLLLEHLAAALFWFDPLRGALHRSLLAVREERCDAAALADASPAARRLYARTLIDELSRPASPVLAAGLIGAGRSRAMRRICAVLDPPRTRPRPALAVGLCALLTCAGGGAAYAANQAAEPLLTWASQAVVGAAKLRTDVAGATGPSLAVVAAADDGTNTARVVQEAAAQKGRPVQAGGVVQRILVLGNQGIDVGTILTRLPIARGQTVTPAVLAGAEQNLRATGLFDDVGITLKGGDLQVWVAEKRPTVRAVFNDPDLQDKTVVSVAGAPVSEAELRQRLHALAMARGVQVSQDTLLGLEADALHSLFEERRQARDGRDGADQPASPPAQPVSPSPAAGEPIAVAADHVERFDNARMTRFSGDVSVVGDLTRGFANAPVQANSPWAPTAAHITRRLVADTVELWSAPSGEIEAVIVHGLRFAE